MDIKLLENINNLTKKYNAQLLPVIKDKKIEEIKEVYDFGFREFGENRLEQLLDHKNRLEKAMFHFIAPLQSRKIDEVMNNCVSIHTLSRKKEALIINKNYSNQKIFIQINIDNDPNKSGIKVEEVDIFFNMFEDLKFFPVGIMCIPSIADDSIISFSNMQKINQKLKKNYKNYKGELSMGMSDDYEIALDYGATLIRIGSKIFS
tara:strand:- start:5479 stop:6093 length:615 start_codon:yes stop_codon:yes gene_type:complete